MPAEEIIKKASGHAGTLTAMAIHGRGTTRWLLGSVADKIVHYSEGPILLVHPVPRSPIAPEPYFRTLVVALDGSPAAEAILPEAAAIAREMGLWTLLVTVTPSISDYLGATEITVETGVANFGSISERADREAQEYLARISDRLRQQGTTRHDTLLAHGDPARAIIEIAGTAHQDSLIAMTTRGRTGLRRTLLGSVADRVVRHARSPVLLVRVA